jgi:NifU-like protein
MGLAALTTSFPWARYSKKLAGKIDKLRCSGIFTPAESEARDMRYVEASEGRAEDGNLVRFYWLVDKDDGIIVDAKFQAFGQSALLGAAEVACDLLVGKNYDQAKRITAQLIDQQVRDRSDVPAFPQEASMHLNLVLAAIQKAAEQCSDLPLASNYTAPPMPMEMGAVLEGGYPGWAELSINQKIAVIEEVLDRDIRPYIALDAGGVKVLNLIDHELIIAYEGSCTSCYSSVGTTLSYIQQTLRAQVHPTLVVVPDLEAK